MGVAKEIVGVDDFGREVERIVVQEDGAEDGALGLEVVRQRAFGDGGFRHSRKLEVRREKFEVEL